ncbi:stage V sporulation protein AB [Lachnoclostridium sp. An181]|uniref:stage V sporulation protein AB n=1 Tax=Lachnoclostridium sp. An181 TaxID=1965575 RepID=UPI000B39BD48|nr:stage V sporulation protein AB [Lachnoclostridium sp. An181]OUP49109.1 stage V sporulation protein AB [Lachnoclostridium sp. An181]
MTQVLLGIIGFSSGVVIAGGLISFIIGLGVISQFADRTHTGDKILLYEECTALGGILGNLMYIYHIRIPYGEFLVPLFGIFGGIFVGCWAMALAEILNIFPIFIRRAKILKAIPYLIVGIALGKGLGGLLYFWQRW